MLAIRWSSQPGGYAAGGRLGADRGVTGEFLGMLTAADIIGRCVAVGRDPRTTPVRSVVQGFGSLLHPADVLGSAVLNVILAGPLPPVPVVQAGSSASYRRRCGRVSAEHH